MERTRCVCVTSVTWEGGLRGFCSAEGRPDLPVGAGSPAGAVAEAWTPGELLVASVNSFVMASFLCAAEQAGVELIRYSSEAEGVASTAGGGVTFCTIRPSVTVAPGHLAGAREAMERARECLVSNSLLAGVRVEPDVSEAAV